MKRLPAILAPFGIDADETKSKRAVARMWGHPDWIGLADAVSAPRCAMTWDEDLPSYQVERRLVRQADVLIDEFRMDRHAANAAVVIGAFQSRGAEEATETSPSTEDLAFDELCAALFAAQTTFDEAAPARCDTSLGAQAVASKDADQDFIHDFLAGLLAED